MTITKPEETIVKEIEEQRPPFPVGLLSRQEKDRIIERGIRGLYRWYTVRSQASRTWHPDSFNWRALRTDHSPELNTVIEGFFAIEQYVPDYTAKATHIMRKSYGRSQFQLCWGAEEEKHADLWLNTMLFLRFRTPEWIEDYMHFLRNGEWQLPWDDALHSTFYVVIQERATQLNYLNLELIATGQSDKPGFTNSADPVLAKAAQTIAIDEAAHFNFFLEVARLFLYYYPAQALEALVDVIKHFGMPAMDLLPEESRFAEALYSGAIYGPRQYTRDVLQMTLRNLGIANRKAIDEGIKRSRQVPDPDGNMRDTVIVDALDYHAVETAVMKLFDRVRKHEEEIGLTEIDPTCFVPSGLTIEG
ncbi:MAG: acyl-ACP desaturase [Deltaproteobacteria bacterium]|nr:acyl-ACP desaturase [Deltaproteobacteria bacterium]